MNIFLASCYEVKFVFLHWQRADSAVVQQDVWSGHVQFVRHYGHSVSASFMSQPYTDTPQVSNAFHAMI